MRKLVIGAVLVLALSGCAVEEEYVPPSLPPGMHWTQLAGETWYGEVVLPETGETLRCIWDDGLSCDWEGLHAEVEETDDVTDSFS